jgi:hypothetical protein
MNRLNREHRARIVHLLCEGSSTRAITRLTGASKTTVMRLVVDAGSAAAWYQDRVLRNLQCKRVQVDEIWGFVGAKAKNAKPALKAARQAGDAWLRVVTDADTKLVASAVEGAFGSDVDYAMLVKLYGEAPESHKGRYSPAECIGCRKQRIEQSRSEARQHFVRRTEQSEFACTRAA